MKKQQPLLFTDKPGEALSQMLSELSYDRLFILMDDRSQEYALPLISDCIAPISRHMITIESGDTQKTLAATAHVWQELSDNQASRKSLLVNLGGGMVTDLGGFAASTFKRGIRFFNIPTTLLGAVDAAVGGKTGINFNGLKNEIGVFNPADAVIVSTEFYRTLPREELLSGYAEMIKHSLIDREEEFRKLLQYDLAQADTDQLLRLLQQSVKVKERIVETDPQEQGIRKALNLGHTVGHAFESFSHRRGEPIPHGYAVAWGLVCELLLSHLLLQFPTSVIHDLTAFVSEHYGAFRFTCADYEALYELMTHDKKNESGQILFTLLSRIGVPEINRTVEKENIFVAFDLFRDLFRI